LRKIVVILLLTIGLWTTASRSQQGPEERTVYDETILQPVYYEPLSYPLLAPEGSVVVRAKFDEQGKVISAFAVSGPRVLVGPSVENIKKWRFRPNPESPANVVVIIYDFRIEGYCVTSPCPSLFTFRPRNTARITKGRSLIDHGLTW
jgi:hypothetical protein